MSVSLLAALVAASLPAVPLPDDAGKAVLYYPTTEGAKRVTQTTLPSGRTIETTETVTKAEAKGGTHTVTVERVRGPGADDPSPTTVLEVSAGGLFVLTSGDKDGRRRLLKAGKEGDTWAADLLGPGGQVGKATRTLGKAEKVTVPAGTYTALRVETEMRAGERVTKTTTWYAPGVGMVKHVTRSEDNPGTTTVLKSFTRGD